MTHTMASLYIALFHGRPSPEHQLTDWGTEGPIIGPIQITWTYGQIKIHDPECSHHENLREVKGLIEFGGTFYGDFDIGELASLNTKDRTVLTFAQFCEQLELDKAVRAGLIEANPWTTCTHHETQHHQSR